MMFSIKESKVDTNFQPSLWSNTKSIITNNTAEDMIRNIFDTPSQYSLKALKNIYSKPDLPVWYIFLCTFCSKFGWDINYLQFTKILPVSKILNWTASVTFRK